MKKVVKIILLVIVALLLVTFIAISSFTGLQVFSSSTQLVTNEGTKGVSQEIWDDYSFDYESFIDTYKVENLNIESSFGEHIVPADYIYAIDSNSKDNKTVIMVHGLGGNRLTNYPIAVFFLEQGYNVVTFDQRSSNDNTAQYTTFGYFEKYDLIDCIEYVEQQAPAQKIGVWGASFGGATAGLAIGHDDTSEKVDFLILDCPISSMEWMLKDTMKDMEIGIPLPYLSWCGDIVNKLKLGFTYQDADVPSAMKNTNTPVLIINSKADTLTPYFMGKDIYDAIQGDNKEIWSVEDSEHFEIWQDYNQEYRDKMESYIKKYE